MAPVARDAIFGVRVDELPSLRALRATCASLLDEGPPARIFTPNPEILLLARGDPTYAAILNTADLALPDGVGVAAVASLRRRRRVRRWPGVDVAATVLDLTAARSAPVAFVGGRGGAAERAAAVWRRRHPGLRLDVVGDDVAFGDDGLAADPGRGDHLLDALRRSGPAVVVVGLGAPKQERWIAEHASALPSVKVFAAVGGAFDMWSGRLRRAPVPLRRLGLEWAWRVALEPTRLPRILRSTIEFPLRALAEPR